MKRFGNATRLLAVFSISLLVLVALAGCGSSKGSGSGSGSSGGGKTYSQDQTLGTAGKVKVNSNKQFNAEQQAIINTIAGFADATQAKDYKKICKDFLTKQSQKFGGDCVSKFATLGASIKDFSIKVTSVTVGPDGKTASADGVTTTNGQQGASQQLTLAKDSKGVWRVSILGQ
jgi:hypothetical protein